MHTLSHSQQLSLLEKKFSNWRHKKRSRERIPSKLWLEAFDLCSHIKYCKVASSLSSRFMCFASYFSLFLQKVIASFG